MQTVLHLTPPLADVSPKPKKKHRENILGQCAGIMQTVLHLTPLADVRLLSQNRKKKKKKKKKKKNIEKSKDFVQNPKKPREIEKNQKKQRFWDNVLVSCKHSVGQIVFFLVFFDFSRFLSVLDKIFRFLDVFLILDGFFRILNDFFLILDTFF